MRILKDMRSRSRRKSPPATPGARVYVLPSPSASRAPSQLAWTIPRNVLERIFSYVCPHSRDESYTSCEDSMAEDGCMLCQMRDLAHCSYICRQWAEAAHALLYHSVRIDAVHFCDREESSPSKRKHKGHDPQNVAEERLKLFNRTVRENTFLGSLVEFLKMPYMLRESCKTDLARAVSMLPNLHYVDLPDGVFSDESSCMTLKQELESRCLELRKMRYTEGAEKTFAMLPHRRMWQNLEVLELHAVDVDAETFLLVLSSFPALHEARLGGNMMVLSDELLMPNPNLPLFPTLERLTFEKAPSITARGIAAYLSRPETREALTFLKLSDTGVTIPELHLVLSSAPNLIDLSISETVSRPFPLSTVPALAARSLENLFFGILPSHANVKPPVSEPYYNYLATSLLSGSFPSLCSLYAYSERLPETLLPLPELPFAERSAARYADPFGARSPITSPLSAPPTAPTFTSPFAHMSTVPPHQPAYPSHISTYSVSSSQSSGSWAASNGRAPPSHASPALHLTGLARPLDLFTKPPAAPEMEWSLTTIFPPTERNGRRASASATRPLSLVALEQGGTGAAMVPPLAPWRERSSSPGGRSLSSSLTGGMGGTAPAAPIRRQSETTGAMAGRVLVGNGFGGFLSVPGAEAQREAGLGHSRPGSKSRGGDWMG